MLKPFISKLEVHHWLYKGSRLHSLMRPSRQNASTIYALSSGLGKCGVSVIRVSGKDCSKAMRAMLGNKDLPPPRTAALRKLRHPKTGEVLDQALALWFPGPSSFTGEDVCEFQVHGGTAVVKSVINALSEIPGLRPAENGEFTKRSFHAGKLDLVQVEGLCDLIHAETEEQRRQALRQMEGGPSKLLTLWRERLIRIIASLEAYIDFSESEEIEEEVLEQVKMDVDRLMQDFSSHLDSSKAAERLREGVQLAIIGEPNVGKSSLLNFLLQREAAIVSPIPGTTRDVIEARLDIGGYPVNIVDTAGIRHNTTDPIEQEGIARAISSAASADLVLKVLDASKMPMNLEVPDPNFQLDCQKSLQIVNKIDLAKPEDLPLNSDFIYISLKSSEGLDTFSSRLLCEVKSLCRSKVLSNSLCLTRERHRIHLKNALKSLEVFQASDLSGSCIEISAQHLRKAVREIGWITGKVSSENILDIIFKDFCIGK